MIKLFSRVVRLISRVSRSNVKLEDPESRHARIGAMRGNSILSTLYTKPMDDSMLDDMTVFGGMNPSTSEPGQNRSVHPPVIAREHSVPIGYHPSHTSSSAPVHQVPASSSSNHAGLILAHTSPLDHHHHRRHTYDSSLRTPLASDSPVRQLFDEAEKVWTELASWIHVLEDDKVMNDRIQVGNRAYAHAMKVS